MSRESIARVLKKLREKSGLTIDQVGQIIGKSGKTVSAWENARGQPDVDTLFLLCDIYKVDDLRIFERDVAENKKSTDPETESVLTELGYINIRENPEVAIVTILKSAGLLNNSGDISDNDLDFLRAMFSAVKAHFKH